MISFQLLELCDGQLEVLQSLTYQVAELSRGLKAEMAAREQTERALRSEIAERQTLAATIRDQTQHVAMETSLRRLEMAIRNMNSQHSKVETELESRKTSHERQDERPLRIGICGTFDVFNYGDLLFPLLADFELKRRLGDLVLYRFSYNAKARPSWVYDVTSVVDLPKMVHNLDGLLIGGGLLLRFDKDVAPNYFSPAPNIHHPTGYWLTPALLALQHNVPLIWNAPGMHKIDIPQWAVPLLDTVLGLSPYISVRDELSRLAIQPLTYQNVKAVPDTGFGLPNVVKSHHEPSKEFVRFVNTHGLRTPYVVFQPSLGFERMIQLIETHRERFANFQFLVVPISAEFGEYTQDFKGDLPGLIRVTEWLDPLLTAELIGRSEAAIGNSYHFSISAVVAGVPVFRGENSFEGKFIGLKGFDTIFVLPPDRPPDLDWFLTRIGRKAPSAAAVDALNRVNAHWDSIADIFKTEQPPDCGRDKSALAIGTFYARTSCVRRREVISSRCHLATRLHRKTGLADTHS